MNKETQSTSPQKPKDYLKDFWKEEEEEILKDWADKAQCYEWMHSRSHNIYKIKNGWYTIPVIIISTITGTANFAQERIPPEYIGLFVMIVGGFNILAGIITTIYQFLKISELNESHRVAHLSWGKFYRNIKTELAKHPFDRMRPTELLKISKEEFDRLLEISPPVPDNVIKDFKHHFKDTPNLTKPEVCDIIMPTSVYDLSDEEREEIKKLFVPPEPLPSQEIAIEVVDKKLEKFKQTFFQLNNRYPTDEEINETYTSLFNNVDTPSTDDDNDLMGQTTV
jgi:hypothetical protein